MDDRRASTRPGTVAGGVGTTALGRLQLRVLEEDGFQEVMIERRWPDMSAARAWCERTVARAAPGTTVLEIQVFAERWRHARSWETTKNHPVAEELQLGVPGPGGSVRWSTPRRMTPYAGARHLI